MNTHTQFTAPQILNTQRLNQLQEELRFALGRTDSAELREWAQASAQRTATLAMRRISGLARFVWQVGQSGWKELADLMRAMNDGQGSRHLGNRTAAAIDGSLDFMRLAANVLNHLTRALIDRPAETAPQVLAAFLGFYAGSGGLDGDGGIPDLDLLAGIDAHRSILTHSILAGIVAESLLLATVDLAGRIHGKLPHHRDPLWDQLAKHASPAMHNLITGTSSGIAYHLLVDAWIQPAPYHDLPFTMPMESHQTLMGANAAAEGLHAGRRMGDAIKGMKPFTVEHEQPPKNTTGQQIVEGIGGLFDDALESARSAADWLKRQWRG
ncbi:MAG: hypothetical protein KBD39_04790 [Sterolibacterium sp.]|nr:hypothetical protein [Sterolibacterium sp.]MBP9799417.1 hypothetical protein [Sterolibacterium sp.]